MAWREIIYEYDGSFEGLLCCVFESYTQKERPTAILRDGDDEPSLFEIRAVTTDRAHAQRIYRSLYKRSPEVGPFLRRAFLTCLPDKEMAIYRFIVKFYREGAPLLSRLSDDSYLPLLKAVRLLSGEVEQFRGFTRFSDFDGNVSVWQRKQSRYPFPASNGLHALPAVLLYPFRLPFLLLLPSQRYMGLLTDNWQGHFEVPEVWQ